MTSTELFQATLTLWGIVAALFVVAGFVTGEWLDKYRELREWIRQRRDHHGDAGMPTASRAG